MTRSWSSTRSGYGPLDPLAHTSGSDYGLDLYSPGYEDLVDTMLVKHQPVAGEEDVTPPSADKVEPKLRRLPVPHRD